MFSITTKKLLLFAIISCLFAVVLGALAAHKLAELINADQLKTFLTANRYQWYHSFAILIVCIINKDANKLLNRVSSVFAIGIVLFSGSLYLLATKDLIGITSTSILGPITPIGGLVFISGWAMFAFYVYTQMFKTNT